MTTKTFPLGTVLSITTGRLLAPNGVGGIYEILNWMTGDNLYTHQLPRVMRECAPFLLKQFPALADVDVSNVTSDNWGAFMNDLAQRYPADFEVEKLPPGEHHEIDPVSELVEKVHPDRIAVVGVMVDAAPQPTPYGLAGIEGDAIVIRLTADACAFAFANDPQAREPRPPVINKQQFLRDTLNELTAEREDGSTPLTDMLDRAMVKAMENGSDALDYDAAGVKGEGNG